MAPKLVCSSLAVEPDLSLYHVGPPLDLGPLPSFFYFALSGPDSLTLDPFNQPVQFLHGQMIRTFSMTLPAHEHDLPAAQALSVWAEEFARGIDPIGNFLDRVFPCVDFAIRERFALPEKMGVGGLSRGGLIAFHAAARDKRFRFLLAFAPLIKLHQAKEFASLRNSSLVQSLDAETLAPSLYQRHIRIYIGNNDRRVDTGSSFDFAMALVKEAEREKVKSPQIELFITPSIGHLGHGTSPEIFRQGANWMAECLKK